MSTSSPFVTVYCRGCGQPRNLSRRQAKRAGLCRDCLYPASTPEAKVNDTHRRFWFNAFPSDRELALVMSRFIGRQVDVARVAEQRMALTASSERESV